MNRIKTFEDLFVWQEAHKLMIAAYDFNKSLPPDEKYNRIIQIKRCTSSIPANIAEGFGRYHYQENIQYCRQARGSLDELKNHIIAARDLNQAETATCNQLIAECNKVRVILNKYIQSTLERKNKLQ
jgi:four helix bundle protein